MKEEHYIFGPVPSRRLGFSLGVDIIPYKICSLNCVYCQLGPTPETTRQRKEYVQIDTVLRQLEETLRQPGRIDYITLSGSGEPTLNSRIGDLIPAIKKLTKIPVALLTNGTTLIQPEVREALQYLDLIVPSLDAGSEEVYQGINRPCAGLNLEGLVRGIKEFTAGFSGQVWLEIMLLKDINDSEDEVVAIGRRIAEIRPDRVQLNTAVRPPAESDVRALDTGEMEQIRISLQSRVGDIPVEVVAGFSGQREEAINKDVRAEILTYLERRPATLDDLTATFGLHRNEIVKYLGHLLEEDLIEEEFTGSKKSYRLRR
ncbi:MAG: radical SAM protein [Candidatus Auribacterota bacterium]|nr:radical SAM protein [Candidatus Auribacterota bacterium]